MIVLLKDLKLIIYEDIFPVAKDNNIISTLRVQPALPRTRTALLLHSLSKKSQVHTNIHSCQCQCCLT